MNIKNPITRDELRKQVYYGQSSVECAVCHLRHNLSSYKSYFIIHGDERFKYQEVFDPQVKQGIIMQGAVCDKIYNELRHIKRKRKAEIQLQANNPKQTKAAHRPARVAIEDRINIATLQANYHVAARHACEVFWLIKYSSVEHAPCKDTAIAYLLETFYCCYHQSIIELSKASNIDMALDASGKQFSRQFLCISFTANFKSSKVREKRVYALYEFTTGGAENLVNMVLLLVSYIHNIQKRFNHSPMRLNDIKSITLDNCNENRGYKNGVAALLQQRRKQEWHALNGNAPYIPMTIKGCDDHKANLVSMHYEKQLIKREKYWGRTAALSASGKVHLATIVIKGVISCMHQWRHIYRHFCRKLEIEPMPYIGVMSARFSVVDIAAILVHQYYLVIVVFFICRWPLLSKSQRQLFACLRSADVRAIIKIRAMGAQSFLLPFMAKISQIETVADYKTYREQISKLIHVSKANPCKLLQQEELTTISTKKLINFVYLLLPYLRSKDKYTEATNMINNYINDDAIEYCEANESSLLVEEIDDNKELVNHNQIADIALEEAKAGDSVITPKELNTVSDELWSSVDDISMPTFPRIWSTNQYQVIPNTKETVKLPNIADRVRHYARDYIETIDKVLSKHEDQLYDQSKTIVASTRHVERVFGRLKIFLDINVQTRPTILLAKILIEEMSLDQIRFATTNWSEKINALRWAWSTTKDHSNAINIDRLYFNSFSKEVAAALKKESKLELIYLIRNYLISKNLLGESEGLTVLKMKFILMGKNRQLPKRQSSIDLLESLADLVEEPKVKSLALNLVRKVLQQKKKLPLTP